MTTFDRAVRLPWVEFTPSWTNLTPGNATQDFRYRYVPGGMMITGNLTIGSTTSISGHIRFTVPDSVTPIDQGGGPIRIEDNTGTDYAGHVAVFSGSVYFYSNTGLTAVTATSPFTFAASDRILVFPFLVPL